MSEPENPMQAHVQTRKVSAMVAMARKIINDYESFLGKHEDMVRDQPKGYITKLANMFHAETGHDVSYQWASQHTTQYRKQHDIPKRYADNKYYTSDRKKAAQIKE